MAPHFVGKSEFLTFLIFRTKSFSPLLADPGVCSFRPTDDGHSWRTPAPALPERANVVDRVAVWGCEAGAHNQTWITALDLEMEWAHTVARWWGKRLWGTSRLRVNRGGAGWTTKAPESLFQWAVSTGQLSIFAGMGCALPWRQGKSGMAGRLAPTVSAAPKARCKVAIERGSGPCTREAQVQPLHPEPPPSLHPAVGRPAPATPIVNPQQMELDLKITILTVLM